MLSFKVGEESYVCLARATAHKATATIDVAAMVAA